MNHLAGRQRRLFRSGYDQNSSCVAELVYGLRKRARLDVRENLFPDRFSILGVDVCNRVESVGPIVREAEAVECQAAESPNLDLSSLADRYQSGALSPTQVIQCLWDGLAASRDLAIWIHLLSLDELLAQAAALERRADERASLPLHGVPFAVKDNIDVAGYPTTAGCPAYRYLAERSAPVVARLIEAGAIFVGKTNMDQFSTGLAGDRSPYGAPCNPFDSSRISGGSSSGSAVAVARGLVGFALGTDTAGSGRVPAGCNNIVGLKPTPGQLSNEGIVPACRSSDCVAIFATTAADAWTVFNVSRGCADSPPSLDEPGLGDRVDSDGATAAIPFRFAIPRPEQLEFFGDNSARAGFESAVERLESLGGIRATIDFRPLQEVAALLYEGPWLAERLAVLGDFLREHSADIYPATRTVLEAGSRYSAADYFKASYRLAALRPVCQSIFDSADMLVVPTMPTLPTLAAVQADSIAWSRRLGYYTNFVNLLGLSAIAIPAGFTPDGLPHGITLIASAGKEMELCRFGDRWQRATGLALGATGNHLPRATDSRPTKPRPCARLCARGSGGRAFARSAVASRFAPLGSTVRAIVPVGITIPLHGLSGSEAAAARLVARRFSAGRRRFGNLRHAGGRIWTARGVGRATAGDRHGGTGRRGNGQRILVRVVRRGDGTRHYGVWRLAEFSGSTGSRVGSIQSGSYFVKGSMNAS